MLYAFESLLSRALSRSLFATRVRPLESCSIFLINLVAIQLFNRLTAHFFFFLTKCPLQQRAIRPD